MATQKIFAQHNAKIDLSALGNKNQIQVVISGPDLKLTSPQGSVTIVNGAIYSSLKDSQLSFQFQDGSLKGKDLLSQVNLENIDFKSADSFLVDQVQNKALQEEQEALKQKMRQAEKDKEEAEKAKEAAEKAREKAEKEKAEAQKAALEAQEAQKSSQQIEEALNEFLTQANTKAALAQITPDERDISLHSASSLHKESSATVEVAQVNKNANRSSGLNNPAPNPKIDLKISLALDDKSNSSGQKDNLTNVTSPKLVGTTMPGTQVTIQKGSTTLGSTKADGQGNFTFTPTDLTDGPHEFMALGEYKGNKAQAKLSLVIKSSTQTPTFEMNSQDIAVDSKNPDIFLIKNVQPAIHGKAEANTQVSIYNKKITDDKETRLDTVQVNSVGEWSYTFKDPQLAQGGNSIRVVAEDAAKNTADITKTIDLDSIPPTIEKIEIAQDSLISGRVANTKTPTFKITTEPDARIQLYLPGNTQPLDIRQSEKVADGKQAYDLTIPEYTFKNDGDHTIQVVATDKRGNSTERTEFNFEVDTVEVGDVEITLENKTGDKASNFTDKESPIFLFKPSEKNITKIEIELKSSDGKQSQKHTLEKESLLRSWTPQEKLQKEGEYTVTATAYKGQTSGNPGSKKIHFYNTPPTIATIELDRSIQGRDPKYTKNSKPTLLVKIDPKDASRAWKVEYEIKNSKGSVENSEVTQLNDTTYTVTPQTDWSHDEYTVIAKLSDKAGNSSTKKETFYFNDILPNPSITFAEKTPVDKIKDGINDKQIIDNKNKTFVIKNAKEGIALHEKDLIIVTLTKKMGSQNTSQSFDNDNKNSEESFFSYDQSKKEWKFVPQTKWDNADYTLKVTVTNQYGSVGNSEDLTFTIVDDVQQPKIELLSSDNTAYDDVEGNITNKVHPKFKFTDIDGNADKVILLIKDALVTNSTESVVFEKETLNTLKTANYAYESQLGENDKSKNYSLTVTTHVGTKNKASDTINLLIDNQLTTPKITLDPEKHPKVLGNTVSSTKPTFRLTDIDPDVREVKLTFLNSSSSDITFDPAKEISEDVANQGVSKKGKNNYIYTPQADWSNGNYKITLTVTDQAKNEKSSEYEVTIDTSTVETPEIILSSNDSFKQKKNITKSKNPNFKLKKIAENAQSEIQISVFSGDTNPSLLGSKTITIKDATETGFDLNKLINTENNEVNITQDGKYQIQAVVTSTAGRKSAPGSLDFTIDSAEAPTHTIELIENTGTDKNPVTNKTSPKFKITDIALDRLDWENPDSIVVTFQKKNSDVQPVTQQLTESEIQKGNNTVEFTANQLEPGEYIVTAKVTYQAGQVGSGSLNKSDGMTIYTTPPESTIRFFEELNKVDDLFKVRQDQMKFNIKINDFSKIPAFNTDSQFKVSVHLTDEQGVEIKAEATQDLDNGIWTADFTKKTLSAKNYTVTATVTDPHGNDGDASNNLQVSLIDKLMLPEIQMVEEDNTPYEGAKKKGEATTHKDNPRFDISHIDDAANELTVTLNKLGVKNSGTVKTVTKQNGRFTDSDLKNIAIRFLEGDGDYTVTVEASNNTIKSSSALRVRFYGTVHTPEISLIAQSVENANPVLSANPQPTFHIKNVDQQTREIRITATPRKEGNTKKSFKAVLDKNGVIKSDEQGSFKKSTDSAHYTFTPHQNWADETYSVVASVINEANKPSVDSSPLKLVIDTSKPEKPSIALSDKSNTTYPDSPEEKWTGSSKPTFTIDLKDTNPVNPIQKVEVTVTGEEEKIYIARKDSNAWRPETNDTSSKKGTFSLENNKLIFTPDDEWAPGKYRLSVKTYNSGTEPSKHSDLEVIQVHVDAPAQPVIELSSADQTNPFKNASFKHITKNPSPGFAISNINLERDNIDKAAVTITITKEGESEIIPGAKVTYENDAFVYKATNFQNNHGDGEYTATVRVTNKAGIPNDSNEFAFEIDTTAPNPPVIDWTSGSLVTTTLTDNHVPQKVATREEDFVFRVKTDTEIDDPQYIKAVLNTTELPQPVKKEEGKNVWTFTYKGSLSTGKNGLSVEVTDKAGNTNNAQGEFMRLGELPTPKIDMTHNTNAAGTSSKPYMINRVNMGKSDTRKLNISLDDNTLFPYVEMKAELISESPGSSSVLSIQKNHPDNNWTVEIPEKQAEGKYTLKVTATDVLGATKKTEMAFVVDTTPPNTPEIELVDENTEGKSFVKTNESLTLTYNRPQFKITFDKEDMDSVNIELKDSDDNVIENKQLTQKEMTEGEYSYEPDTLANQKDYILTVTATDKAGNQSPTKKQNFNINTSELQQVDIELKQEDKTGDKTSNFTHKKRPTLIFKTKEDNIDRIEIFKKVEESIEKIDTLESSGGFQKNEDQRCQIPENIFNKDGKYTIIAQPYRGIKPGPTTEIEIDFYQNAPEVKDIQLNAASKSTVEGSEFYTNNSTPGFLITVPDGDQHRVWKMQVLVIKQSTANPLETIEITDTLFSSKNTHPVITKESWSKGEYQIAVTLTDKAGNASTQKTQEIHFDDTEPEPVIGFDSEASINNSAGKTIINNQNRKFVIKGTDKKPIEESDEIEVTLTQINKKSSKEKVYNSKKNQKLFRYDKDKTEQTFSLSSEDDLDKGDFELNVKVTDRYGNTGNSQEPLSFTIQDAVEKPKIHLLDDTSYQKEDGVHITNKPEPRFKLTQLDEHATRVEIKTTPDILNSDPSNDTFDGLANNNDEKNRLKNSFQLKKSWTTNGDYKLSVNTFVDEEPSPETTLTVIFDNKLNPPRITLDEETIKSSSASHTGAIVASQTPKFNLLDIEEDVKHILLQVYKDDDINPVEKIQFDIKDLEDTDKKKNIEGQGVKRTDSGYTYQPSEWADKAKYKISLTVTDRASNRNDEDPAKFEVNIDTEIAKIPSITLNDNDAFNKDKKFITKSQNPSFKLDNIDDRAAKITITIYKPGSTTDILASHTFPKETRTFNVNQLILADIDKSELSSLADGQYTIKAQVTLNTKKLSEPGTLFFTVDHADAPTHTIELVGNTGTDKNPVTNKTSPKFKITNIAPDRLDWNNLDSIVVTFQNKKTKEEVTQQFTESDIQENNTVEFTANQLKQGEYTVTAKVTYQAGQSKSTTLADLNIYTTPPESRIEFFETLDKAEGLYKVRQDQMEFNIIINDLNKIPNPNKEGQFKVLVHLKNEKGVDVNEEAKQDHTNGSIWTADFTKKTLSAKNYTVTATVTDPHGNSADAENPLEVSVIDKLMLPEIQMVEEDNTPYEGAKKKGEATTHKDNPRFNISHIDDAANELTVTLKKPDGTTSEIKTIKKQKGGFQDSDFKNIAINLKDDGVYTVTVEASNQTIKSSSALTVRFYGTVLTPDISLMNQSVENGQPVLSANPKPIFEIKKVDPQAREIHITATSSITESTPKNFELVLDKNGAIKSVGQGRFEKSKDSSYTFTPNQNWENATYSVVASVINEAQKTSLDSSPLALVIDTSKPAQPSIALSDKSNTTYPDSLEEKWTGSSKPVFTIDLKDTNPVNPIQKVEVMVTRETKEEIYIAKKDRNAWSPETNDKSSKKGAFSLENNKLIFTPDDEWAPGKYTLSVKTYNSGAEPSETSKSEVIHVHVDAPAQPKIELAYADQTGKTIDKNNTKITNNPNPGFAISNINLERDSIDKDAVTITITKESKSIIPGAKVTYENGGFSYNTTNFKDTNGEGEYTATVRVTNKAGRPSTSGPFTFEIDTTAPNPPEIDWTSGSFVTMTNPTDNHVLKTVAKREENFVFQVKTDKEIDDPEYITAFLNTTHKLHQPVTVKKEEKEGKNIWKFTFKQNFSTGKNGLSVEVKDKAGNKNTAQGDFMVLEELPAPTIDMNHNTNAAGQTSTPYMINKVNMVQNEKRKLNISLDDNTLFPYVEMKAELISAESPGSSSVLSIKKNNLDNNWTVEIPGKQADAKYRLKVIATDVLKRTQETEVDFVVDTTPPNIPAIQLNDSGTKSAESTDAQETTQTKPVFMIRNIPEDIYKINITISGDNNDYEIKNLEGFKRNSKEWGGILKDLEDNNEYSITVTFTDKAGNTSSNGDNPYQIKKIAPFVFKDPELILDPDTDSGTQGDFKTNHKQPVLRFKNMSDTAVTALKITLTPERSDKTYTYTLTQNDSINSKGNEYTIELIKTTSLKGQDLFPAGKYEVTLELTYENNEKYKIPKTLSQSLIINRDKPDAVHEVKYTFDETADGAKTIRIEGKKPKNTDIFIQFHGQTEINIKKQNGDSLFSDDTFSTTQPWGQQKSFTLFVKDDIGNQSENNKIEIPQPPAITRYRALEDGYLHIEGEKVKKGDTIILKNKNIRKSSTAYEFKVQSEDGTFSFNTNTADDNKKTFKESQELTAYVQSKEGYESEKITKSIPKMPDEVAYTFTGNGRYLVVKGKVKNGESLNVKNDNFVQKGNQSLTNKPAWTIVENSNQDLKKFSVFASNHEGGESLAVEQEMPTLLFYWDNDAQRYQGIFNIQSAAADYLPDRTDSDNGLDYVHRLSIKSSDQLKLLVNYKIFESFNANNSVIELDNDLDYELINILSSANSYTWIFSPNSGLHQPIDNKQDIKSNSNMIKFIDKDKVKEFFKLEENFINPSKNAETEARDKKLMKDRWELRPIQLKAKYEGKYQDWGNRNITIAGKILKKNLGGGEFIVTDVFNRKADNLKQKFNPETGKFTISYTDLFEGGKVSDAWIRFRENKGIASFYVAIKLGEINKTELTEINDGAENKFKELLKQNGIAVETPPPSSLSSPSEATEEEQSEKEADSTETTTSETSEAEQEKHVAKRSIPITPEDDLMLTEEQGEKKDATPEAKTTDISMVIEKQNEEHALHSSPQNPIELLNPITSEENTTADLTPSFTLNAPKEAPDAVKAVVTLDNRPEYALELIDNQGVFTVEMPLAEGPHELKVKFIDPDGDWIRLDKTFTIDASSERILSSLETPDRYQSDLSTGSKTSLSKENADILMMTPVLHLPEHEEESIYYG